MTHSQQLQDHEVAAEIIREALKDIPKLDLRVIPGMIQETFNTKLKRDINIVRAREIATSGLVCLDREELRALWANRFERLVSDYFSKKELQNEISFNSWGARS